MNTYLRGLNCLGNNPQQWAMPKEEGDILITPDGLRWRIERTPTVGDLLHVGDVIRTSYKTGGLVIKLEKYSICCCPHRSVSSTIICKPSWDPPKQTLKYHRELPVWSLVYVQPGARQTKAGKFFESDYCYINELVAVGNRILALFEANEDEVFVSGQRIEMKPMQLEMFTNLE